MQVVKSKECVITIPELGLQIPKQVRVCACVCVCVVSVCVRVCRVSVCRVSVIQAHS